MRVNNVVPHSAAAKHEALVVVAIDDGARFEFK